MVKIASNTYETQSDDGLEQEFARFPYPLSPFQKHSIEAITKGQSVLVTAHTGSGKTVPAEFAIQYFVERGKKVIYCSPIKALSNQKFYEFQQKYPQISFGLLTGDNKINAAADCLIMTTEILMNTGNRGTGETTLEGDPNTLKGVHPYALCINIETELAAVIFDEVHYINDADRGHVWERTIMSLPTHVQLILLSATIDQPIQFAEWIEQTDPLTNNKKREVVLCSTTKRVVPLGHYSFITTTEAAYKKIKDKVVQEHIRRSVNKLVPLQTAEGRFQDGNIHDIASVLGHLDKNKVEMKRKYVLNKLLQHLTEKEMTPAILFLFSRKQVELCAQDVTTDLLEFDSKVPYMARHDAEQMIRKLPNYAEYMALPQYETLIQLLEKGVGIHHAGMIPVFREIVELFISKKWIKLLIATESFAIGLDCPIKSAIFTGFTKWDGKQDRMLMPHEYTQMAGRAGRRGIDTIGYVIHCNNVFHMPSITEYKTLLSGTPERFKSKFQITTQIVLAEIAKDVEKKVEVEVDDKKVDDGISIESVVQYMSQSMASKDMQKQAQKQEQLILGLQNAANQYVGNTGNTQVVKEYMEKKALLSMVSHKRQKELEKDLAAMSAQNKTLLSDVKQQEAYAELQKELHVEQERATYLSQYTLYQVQMACQILEDGGFIRTRTDRGTVCITEKGRVAAQIREVNGFLLANLLFQKNLFENESLTEIIAVLSCFIEVRLPEDSVIRHDTETKLGKIYAQMSLDKDELDTENHGNQSLIVLQPYLMEPIVEWCEQCNTEVACKYFVQTRLNELDMSLGDFVKVVLKLVAACKELSVAAASSVQLQHKLAQADILLSKFIMTSQSLYL